ncbi:MAG: DUF4129 domain-containing protein [Alloprevotella sp.]|nr:DUF4129 domain-containing protein [Alloprevotella sp.]
MPALDTLRADSTLVQAWTSNPDFDYVRDLSGQDESMLTVVMKWIGQYVQRLFSALTNSDTVSTIAAIGIVLLVLVGGYFAWRHLGKRRGRVKISDVEYTVSEDSIYGVDFDRELELALAGRQHRQAVRLLYLRTLRHLHDAGCLCWSLTQTPREFVDALQDDALRAPFSRMTTAFVRVRYGHFPATAEDVERMSGWARETDAHIPRGEHNEEKGGEA